MLNHWDELASIEANFVQLEAMLGMDLRGELLRAYFVTQAECFAALDLALHAGNVARVIEMAHKLKGATAQLGALQLSASCKRLEQQAHIGRLDEFGEHWQSMCELAHWLEQELKP